MVNWEDVAQRSINRLAGKWQFANCNSRLQQCVWSALNAYRGGGPACAMADFEEYIRNGDRPLAVWQEYLDEAIQLASINKLIGDV